MSYREQMRRFLLLRLNLFLCLDNLALKKGVNPSHLQKWRIWLQDKLDISIVLLFLLPSGRWFQGPSINLLHACVD